MWYNTIPSPWSYIYKFTLIFPLLVESICQVMFCSQHGWYLKFLPVWYPFWIFGDVFSWVGIIVEVEVRGWDKVRPLFPWKCFVPLFFNTGLLGGKEVLLSAILGVDFLPSFRVPKCVSGSWKEAIELLAIRKVFLVNIGCSDGNEFQCFRSCTH